MVYEQVENPNDRIPNIAGDLTIKTESGFRKVGKLRLWIKEREMDSRKPPLVGYIEISEAELARIPRDKNGNYRIRAGAW